MADSGPNVEFTAGITGLLSGISESIEAIEGFSESVTASIKGVGAAIESIEGPFVALVALFEGYKEVKDVFEAKDVTEYANQVHSLAVQLGLSASQASILNVALKEGGVSSQQYSQMANRLALETSKTTGPLQKLGIDMLDSEHHLKSAGDQMSTVINYLEALPSPAAKSAAIAQIFGKNIEGVNEVLEALGPNFAQAKKDAEELGLIMDGDSVKGAKEYQAEMRKLGLVFLAFKIQVAEQMMPIITAFSEFMRGGGSTALEIFTDVLKGTMAALIIVAAYIKIQLIDWSNFTSAITQSAKAAHLALGILDGTANTKENWIALTKALKDTDSAISGTLVSQEQKAAQVAKVVEETRKSLEKLASHKQEPDVQGGGGDAPKQNIKGKLVAEWKEELENIKLARENWYTWDDERELEFWQKKLSTVKKGTAEYQAALKEVANLQKKVNTDESNQAVQDIKDDTAKKVAAVEQDATRTKTAFAARKLSREQEVTDLKADEDKKLAIQVESLRKIMAMESTTPAQAKKLLAEIEKAYADHGKKIEELEAQAQADIAKDADTKQTKALKDQLDSQLENFNKRTQLIEGQFAKQQITWQQEIAGLKLIEQQKLQAEVAEATAELALTTKTEAEKDKIRSEMQSKYKAFLSSMDALDKKSNDLQVAESKKTASAIEATFNSVISNYMKGIGQMINGQLSFSQAMQNAIKVLGQAFLDFVGKMVEQFLSGLAQQAAAWLAGLVTQETTQATSGAATAAEAKTAATIAGMAWAGQAAAAAAASVAAIPFTGWMMAPIVAASTFTELAGIVASAAGGYDIPAGVSPVVQAHPQEMILPASLANSIRQMVASQGSGGGKSSTSGGMSVQISAMDGASVQRVFQRNGGAISKSISSYVRDGRLKP